MSLISSGIISEMYLLGVVILWISKQNIQPYRKPSLSKRTMKNLEF